MALLRLAPNPPSSARISGLQNGDEDTTEMPTAAQLRNGVASAPVGWPSRNSTE